VVELDGFEDTFQVLGGQGQGIVPFYNMVV
jgi:hypothetical protein